MKPEIDRTYRDDGPYRHRQIWYKVPHRLIYRSIYTLIVRYERCPDWWEHALTGSR